MQRGAYVFAPKKKDINPIHASTSPFSDNGLAHTFLKPTHSRRQENLIAAIANVPAGGP